jgi:hypothetical protein
MLLLLGGMIGIIHRMMLARYQLTHSLLKCERVRGIIAQENFKKNNK